MNTFTTKLTNSLWSTSKEVPDNPVSDPTGRIEQEVVSLYEEYATVLIRYAFSFSKDKELAQDAVQVSFFRYFLHRKAGNAVENPRGWLFRVVRNYVMDRLREVSSRCEVPISEIAESAAMAGDYRPSYEQNELLSHIPHLLSPRELECVQLRQQGLRYDEIAAVLKISPGTVGALLTRALKKLRVALGWL
jgi:RNA polymerase sigma-70 factor (ECF subfamily)